MAHKLQNKLHDYHALSPSVNAGGLFFHLLERMLMTYDDPWLAMLEELYGKDYVEQLLAKDNGGTDNRQGEESEAQKKTTRRHRL